MNQMPEQMLRAQDAANRVKALELRSFIVEAPAGAGKTELLTQRYLKLLSQVNAPEEIIALTFTNKATAEMRSRILQSLQDAVDGVPIADDLHHKKQTRQLALQALARDAQLGWNLLTQPARLRILTIDALCGSLTQQMPLLSRFGGQPVLVDDASLHYTEAAQLTIAQVTDETDANGAVSQVLAFLDNNAEKLTALLANMLARRDQWLPLLVNTHTDSAQIAAQTQQILAEVITPALQASLDALSSPMQLKLMPTLRYAAANQATNFDLTRLQDWQTPLQADMQDLPDWLTLCDFLLTEKNQFRSEKGLNTASGFPKDDPDKKAHVENFAQTCAHIGNPATLAALRDLPVLDNVDIARNASLVAAFGQVLKLATGHLWGVFQGKNEVDFVQITQSAIDALAEETDLAIRLDYQVSHLLVDEFQDTSPTQIKLLILLTQGWQPNDRRTLFCVGDPMQSIYRFRKADVKGFLQASQHGIGQITLEPLKLSLNNRSHPEIIHWVNDSFARIFPPQDLPHEAAISYRPATPQKAADKNAGVQLHALVLDNSQNSAAARLAEARHIAKLIMQEQAVHKGQKIAVLARSRTHLRTLVSVIRHEFPSLSFQAVDIEALNERQSVLDALSLTRALLHPADRVHWLAILRAPWCGLKLNDLHKLCGDNHHATIWQLLHDEVRIDKLSADAQQRILHTKQVLKASLAEQGRLPLRRWLETTWLRLRGANTLLDAGDVRDVQTFFDLVEQLSQGYFVDFTQLDTRMQQLYAKPDLHGNPDLQLMTMHASKGLEFDCVILPALNAMPKNDDKPLMLWEDFENRLLAAPLSKKDKDKTSLYDLLLRMEKARTRNESARLLYVAATRAKRKLHLVAAVIESAKNERKPQSASLLEQLWPCVEADFAHVPVQTQAQATQEDLADFSSLLTRLPAHEFVQHAAEPTAATPLVPTQNAETIAPDLPKDMGTLAHLYLEMLAKGHVSAAQINTAQAAMQRWLQIYGHDTHQSSMAASQILRALQTTLQSTHGQWILQARENAQAEYALVSSDGETHVIDRTFVEDGVRWIIDYKLGLDVTEQNAAIVAQSHKPQLEHYAALFADDNLPVKSAVFFLSIGKLVAL